MDCVKQAWDLNNEGIKHRWTVCDCKHNPCEHNPCSDPKPPEHYQCDASCMECEANPKKEFITWVGHYVDTGCPLPPKEKYPN